MYRNDYYNKLSLKYIQKTIEIIIPYEIQQNYKWEVIITFRTVNKELFVCDKVDKHFQEDLRITIIQSIIEQKEYLINNEQINVITWNELFLF